MGGRQTGVVVRAHAGASVAAVLVSGLAVLLSVAAVLLSAPPAAGARSTMDRVGPQPTVPHAAVVRGPVRFARPLRVTVALKPRDPRALAAYARAVSTPGSADYRAYLTPSRFARHFGATAAAIRTVVRSLRARGLAPGPVSAGGLSIPVAATAGQVEHGFAISLRRLSLPGRRTAITAGSRPAVAAAAAPAIQAVVGLDTTAAPRPLLVRRAPGVARRAGAATTGAAAHTAAATTGAAAHTAAAAAEPCSQARQALSAPYGQGAHTDDQIASVYAFSGIYAAGDAGAATTVAVYELEPNAPSDIAAYQACYGTHASISYVPVDGGAGTGSGAGEAALDIENLIGFAPDVHVLVYQGPNSNSGAAGSGPYDTFSKIINQNRARVVTVSWGQCESAVGRADAIAEETLFEQATVQGQSIVAADGDTGAQDCDQAGSGSQTQPAVDDPSSQPFVTAVGGTSLTSLGPRPTETVWNSGGQPLGATIQAGAGGGGVSSFWSMPAAQLNAAAALGVRSAAPNGTACGNAGGYCRAVPDVAADADPATGYLFYWNGNGSVAGQPAGWQGIGGTSAAAPLWAALLALADSSSACAGSAIGYPNPDLYRTAGTAYAVSFNDVTTGENDFTQTNGGRYAAKVGYDPVTGLGTPNAAALVRELCANTVHLIAPPSQRTTVHAAAYLRLRTVDTTGAVTTFGATGLPPGLTLNARSGVISGRPTRTGRYTVRLTVRDSAHATGSTSLTWIVGSLPRISRLSLSSAGHSGASLTVTLTAGLGAPSLETVTMTLPSGLRLGRSRRGISVTAAERPLRLLTFTEQVTGGTTITIRLSQPAGGVRIALAPPALRQSGGRFASAARRGRRLAVGMTVTDAAAGSSRVTARVAARR